MHWAMICAANDMAPVQDHVITWTNYDRLIVKFRKFGANWNMFLTNKSSWECHLQNVSNFVDLYKMHHSASVCQLNTVEAMVDSSMTHIPLHKNGGKITDDNFNTLRLRQDGCHFADDILKCIFLNENVWIPIEISLKFVPMGPIDNIPALV